MSLRNDIEFIKETASSDLVKKHLKLVFDTYQRLYKEVCHNCPTKVAGYIKRIKNHNNTVMATKEKKEQKSAFVLQTGAQIIVRGKYKSYSNANLTDELALKFLKANPNRKQLFAKLPDNINELLSIEEETNDEVEETVKIDSEINVSIEVATEALDFVGSSTKAKTVSGVQKRIDGLDEEQKNSLKSFINEKLTKAAANDEVEETGDKSNKETSEEEE